MEITVFQSNQFSRLKRNKIVQTSITLPWQPLRFQVVLYDQTLVSCFGLKRKENCKFLPSTQQKRNVYPLKTISGVPDMF